jgi:hypothetical protein
MINAEPKLLLSAPAPVFSKFSPLALTASRNCELDVCIEKSYVHFGKVIELEINISI